MSGVRFDPRTHTYWLGERVVPSVTQVLTLAGFIAEPPAAMRDNYYLAGLRGSYVHEACHLLDHGRTMWVHNGRRAPWQEVIDPRLRLYVESYLLAVQEEGWQVIGSEVQLVSVDLGIAGTCDKIVRLHDGHIAVVDLKQSATIPPWTRLQLAGYATLLDEHSPVPNTRVTQTRATLHLQPTDTRPRYAVEWYDDGRYDEDTFLAAATVAEWKIRHGALLPELPFPG